jgi:ribosomal protein S18 acetylase RimI-like enzyme
MAVGLVPLSGGDFAGWLKRSRAGYVDEAVASGVDRERAEQDADEQLAEVFPGGAPSPGQHVYRIVEGDERVGWIWIGPAPVPAADWWVYDIEVAEASRGKGIGQRAMELAEDIAREHGANTLGLNVFAHNEPARKLYERLGYRPVSTRMVKEL